LRRLFVFFPVLVASLAVAQVRGYVTTPGELAVTAQKAAQGVQPYKNAVLSIENFANTGSASVASSTTNPYYWPYGSVTGYQACTAIKQPYLLWAGGALVEAKAEVYRLTGDNRYADDVRTRLLDLTDTYGYNSSVGSSDVYSGSNQCILNLSWYIPGWIIGADLIDGYSGWTAADKQKFQNWLATVIFKKVQWASDRRSNNWGSAGSMTTGMIADYLSGSGILMVDRTGAKVGSRAAYLTAKQRQLDRMNGNSYMDNYGCHLSGVGFRPDGGIPEELMRGTTGCYGEWILTPFDLSNPSYYYPQTHLQSTIMHAEFLLRRGDRSLYDNITSTGAGSLHRAILFLLHNPNDTSKSAPWWGTARQPLEMAYRYYRDPYIAKQLGIGTTSRYIGGANGQMAHFGTITHGFATNENPGLPPVTPPPAEENRTKGSCKHKDRK
jgi:hypothetical protein